MNAIATASPTIDVAGVLERIADLLEFKDENPFKLRSYRVAAETIAEMQTPIAEVATRGATSLQELPGIGKSLSAQIIEIVQTGTSTFFEELKEEIPESVLELRKVSGIGLKTSQQLYRDFGIKSLDELKAFAEGGGLESVTGLGDKTAARIKSSLARLESERGKVRLNEATELAAALAEQLRAVGDGSKSNGATRLEVVGQIRRGCEMVDNVELLACGRAEALAQAFVRSPQLTEIKAQRADRVEAMAKKGVAVTLHFAAEADFAAAMVRTTGSVEHLRDLEAEALRRGYAFKGFQIGDAKTVGSRKRKSKASDGQPLTLRAEEEFYSALGLEFIAPELREGLGEVAAARDNCLPELIRVEDMRGDFHMHTTWSDGQNSIREMIEAARRRGYQYIAITDHTQSTSIANGNTPDELLSELAEIEAAARDYDDIRVLKGAEVDILSDGSLDMPFEVLEQITERVVRAMETGYPNVFAHPTGRILGERAGYEIDLEQVIAAARQHNVRLELNASPYRLDLNSYWLGVAKQAGVGFVISTDSHTTRGFESMRYGIATARRAWLTRDDVLNTLPLPKLLAELERKKRDRRPF